MKEGLWIGEVSRLIQEVADNITMDFGGKINYWFYDETSSHKKILEKDNELLIENINRISTLLKQYVKLVSEMNEEVDINGLKVPKPMVPHLQECAKEKGKSIEDYIAQNSLEKIRFDFGIYMDKYIFSINGENFLDCDEEKLQAKNKEFSFFPSRISDYFKIMLLKRNLILEKTFENTRALTELDIKDAKVYMEEMINKKKNSTKKMGLDLLNIIPNSLEDLKVEFDFLFKNEEHA